MHIIFVTLLCVSSTLFCSAPQQRNFPSHDNIIENTNTRRLTVIHNRISPFVSNTSITQMSGPIQGELFFACLPQELRIRTLSQNFFNGDTEAAEELEEKPYAWSLYLLAEYQQKPKPYIHLQPKWILLLPREQVRVVNEIEKQYIESQKNPPAAPGLSLWFFRNKYTENKKLSYEDIKIIKTIPLSLISSPINGQVIAYPDQNSPNKWLHIAKDVIKSCLCDDMSRKILTTATLTSKILLNLWKIQFYTAKSFSALPAAFAKDVPILVSLGIDGHIFNLLDRNIIPSPFNYQPHSWACIRTGVDLIGLGLYATHTSWAQAKTYIPFTILPHLEYCIWATLGAVGTVRHLTQYPNRYIVTNGKKKSWCTLV